MKIIFIFFLSLLAAIFQLAFLSKIIFLGATLNLLLTLVLFWAIIQKEKKNSWLILLPVFLFDILAGQPFGVATLSLCLVFYLILWLTKTFFARNDFLAVLALVFFGTLFFEIFEILFSKIASLIGLAAPQTFFYAYYFYATLPTIIFSNVIFCLIVFWSIKKVKFVIAQNGISF